MCFLTKKEDLENLLTLWKIPNISIYDIHVTRRSRIDWGFNDTYRAGTSMVSVYIQHGTQLVQGLSIAWRGGLGRVLRGCPYNLNIPVESGSERMKETSCGSRTIRIRKIFFFLPLFSRTYQICFFFIFFHVFICIFFQGGRNSKNLLDF